MSRSVMEGSDTMFDVFKKTWDVHQKCSDGIWYSVALDMLQSDAERLFDIYAKRCPNTPTRLIQRNRIIREANTKLPTAA